MKSGGQVSQHVGFRGIGIYSGFDLCRQLVITSKREGSSSTHVMSFGFAEMKARLDQERQQVGDTRRTSLLDLLSGHTTIARRDDDAEISEHFTQVELRDIQPEHIALLSDRTRLREYLLQNLPIAFAPSFTHGAAIDKHLRDAVPGYNPIVVKLQLAGQPEEIVQKYGPTPQQRNEHAQAEKLRQPGDAPLAPLALKLKLAEPSFREIHNSRGQPIAFYWACLNQERARLEPKEEKPQYEGFIYKVKGFSIGDRNKLRARFPRPQLYPWFTGEVYVLDPHVVPNAERNDFETSTAKNAMELALQDDFRKFLKPRAERFQATAKAEEKIDEYANNIALLERDFSARAGAEALSQEDNLSRLNLISNIIEDLPSRKRVAGSEAAKNADALLTRAKALQKSLANLIQNPASEIRKRRREAEAERPEVPAGGGDAEAAVRIQRLEELFVDAGLDLGPERAEVVAIMQGAMDDLLGPGSADYQRFIGYVADRLSDLAEQG